MIKNKILLLLCLCAAGLLIAQTAAAGERKNTKYKSYDRPYGNSVNNDFQTKFYSKRRGEAGESLFSQDLHEDAPIGYKQKKRSWTEDQSYLYPPNKKTNPGWGSRQQ